MVGENWYVFKQRMLVEKHISGIMNENPGVGHDPFTSSSDAHAYAKPLWEMRDGDTPQNSNN